MNADDWRSNLPTENASTMTKLPLPSTANTRFPATARTTHVMPFHNQEPSYHSKVATSTDRIVSKHGSELVLYQLGSNSCRHLRLGYSTVPAIGVSCWKPNRLHQRHLPVVAHSILTSSCDWVSCGSCSNDDTWHTNSAFHRTSSW